MTWLDDDWLDLLGWGGSALSLSQASALPLGVLNAIACLVLIAFGAAIQVWPKVGMNSVLLIIHAWHVVQLRHRHDESAYLALEVSPSDTYLLDTVRRDDIVRFDPGVVHDPSPSHDAFSIQKGNETLEMVLLHAVGDPTEVELDSVAPRSWGFSPREFVWRPSGGPYNQRLGLSVKADCRCWT